MVNSHVKFFSESSCGSLESVVNTFLNLFDVRQIIKIEHSCSQSQYGHTYSCMVFYLPNFEDIRDIKLDKILEL